MNKKQIVRLTESDLHRIVKESVNKVLKEGIDDEKESHSKMWGLMNDAYNYCLNMTEGGDLYIKAFEEHIFPLIRSIDEKLGWR